MVFDCHPERSEGSGWGSAGERSSGWIFVLYGMRTRECFVYILASRSRTLYVGVTHHLGRRLTAHREGSGSRFTEKYRVRQLVYFERYGFVGDALRREKQLKGWTRAKKIALIEAANPAWRDLAVDPLPDPSLRSG